MSELNKEKGKGLVVALATIFSTIAIFFASVIWKGASQKSTWKGSAKSCWMVYLITATLFIYSPNWNLPAIVNIFSGRVAHWIRLYVPVWAQLTLIFLVPLMTWLFCKGLKEWISTTKYQRAINHLGIKSPTGLAPKVVRVIELETYQRKILVHAIGLDVSTFRDRKGALESSLNSIVQEVRVASSNRQIFEILISDKELPKLVRFDEMAEQLSRPYTFLVGQSADKFYIADLCEIHHMLIAGATGGGKSVFFKQALIGLLKSSSYIQLYLLDLKRGVDVKPFEALENVAISKDNFSALATLDAVVIEMERRFKYLEESSHTEIVPLRDKMDRIVVAVDEASVLFTIDKNSKETKAQAQNARELTDKIAKLGRAAGIHVILATQKVVKETIDTRVQTNINARMCFRVNTVASSMTVLGNKKAAELPDIKGRGIWSVGSNDIIVQVPKLDNDEVTSEVGILTNKFNGANNPLLQNMLMNKSMPKKKRNLLIGPETEEKTAVEGIV